MEQEDMQRYFLENKYKTLKSLYEAEIDIKKCYCKTMNNLEMSIDVTLQNQLIQYMDKLRNIRYMKGKVLGFERYIDLRIKEKGYCDYKYKDLENYQKIIEKYLSLNSQYAHDYFKRRYNRKKYDELITEKDFDKEFYSYLIPLEDIKDILGELILYFPEEEQIVFKHLFLSYRVLENGGEINRGSFCTIENEKITIYLSSRNGKVDIFEAIHELGHAYQLYYAQTQNRFPKKEVCEVYSIGMELAALPYMEKIFPEQDVFRFYFFQLFIFFIYEAMLLEFQEIIYSNNEIINYNFVWEKLQHKYKIYEEYTDDSYLKKGMLWLKESEIFLSPLLLTDYALAQIFVLSIYFGSLNHKEYIFKYCELVKRKQGISIWKIYKGNQKEYFEVVIKKYVEFILERL